MLQEFDKVPYDDLIEMKLSLEQALPAYKDYFRAYTAFLFFSMTLSPRIRLPFSSVPPLMLSKEHFYFSEFSRCGTEEFHAKVSPIKIRLGSSAPENLESSARQPSVQVNDRTVYYSPDVECGKTRTSNLLIWPGQHASRLRMPFQTGDYDSSFRVIVMAEIVRGGADFTSIDPDIVWINKEDMSQLEGVDWAMSAYCGETRIDPSSLNNFAQFYVSSSANAYVMFKAYEASYFLDVEGTGDSPFDPNAHPPVLGPQCMDDQHVFLDFWARFSGSGNLKEVRAGPSGRKVFNEGAEFVAGVFPCEQYPMVMTAKNAFHGYGPNADTVRLHMAGFGSWKDNGLADLGYWFKDAETVEDEIFLSIHQDDFSKLIHKSSEEDAVWWLLSIAQTLRRVPILPRLNCEHGAQYDSISESMRASGCFWPTRYDYGGMRESCILFISNSITSRLIESQQSPLEIDWKDVSLTNVTTKWVSARFQISDPPKSGVDSIKGGCGVASPSQVFRENPRPHGCC